MQAVLPSTFEVNIQTVMNLITNRNVYTINETHNFFSVRIRIYMVNK